MKKLVSILLALAMILCMGATALAAEEVEYTTLTIKGEEGRTYVGYKLLDLTSSFTADHTDHEGSHTNKCYNFAYTVNEKYTEILQQEVYDNGGNYLWDEDDKPIVSEITDVQILKYLENQKSDDGDVFHTMRQVADRLYRAIKDANMEPDAVDLTDENDNIAQGYWMIVDVTNLDDAEGANSLVMVDTKGLDALTINTKTALPTVEKKVKDIEDSEDDNISDNPWHDSADHDINDKVPFKLTATLPSNFRAYIVRNENKDSINPYKLVFHDTLSEGLTFVEGSVKVYMYETKHKADVDTDLNEYLSGNAVDVTDSFQVTTEGLTDGCTFEVSCVDVIKINGVTKDSTFVVYYEATLNEEAVMGAAGNPNQVYLEFSNDPYGTSTGKTEEDTVTVFTYQLVINKTDASGKALKGAAFKLYKKNLKGEYSIVGEELKGEDMTTFTWKGLDDGDYKLEESEVPKGYNKMSDVVFSISATHSEISGEPTLISLDGGLMGTGVVNTGVITKDVVNSTGIALPETGARGTLLLISGSTMVVMMAAIFMITRKKMSIYED